jgi:hypothetical protein
MIPDRDRWQWMKLLVADPRSELSEQKPSDFREAFRPILLSLLCLDPTRRASVGELTQNKWLLKG